MNVGELLKHTADTEKPTLGADNVDLFTQFVESLSRDEGFNIIEVPAPKSSEGYFEVYVQEKTKRGRIRKKSLPINVDSEKPEVVTGTQGLKKPIEAE